MMKRWLYSTAIGTVVMGRFGKWLRELIVGTGILMVAAVFLLAPVLALTPGQFSALLAGAANGSGVQPIPPTSNDSQYYGLFLGTGLATSAAPTQNLARCAPFLAPGNAAQHVDQLSMSVTTLGTGPITVALYTDAIDSTTHRHQPQTLLASGSFTVTSVATVTAAMGTNAVGVPLSPGLNWACVNDVTAADAVRFATYSSSSLSIANLIGSATTSQVTSINANISSLTNVQTSGTWPSFVGATFADNVGILMPLLSARVASVP